MGVAAAVAVGVLLHQTLASSPSAATTLTVPHPESAPTVAGFEAQQVATPGGLPPLGGPAGAGGGHQGGRLTVADGIVPAGVTVFDDAVPAVAKLDPALLAALRRAASAAQRDHVTILVNSGWRSAAYQQHLLDAAIRKYGSEAKAARWVAPPTLSEHVAGHAVDVGPSKAASWLSRHGAAYGLCQIYRNERWHFELRPDAAARGCPAMYADPTKDPRLNP